MSADDERYVHRPDDAGSSAESAETAGVGSRGWVLVAVLVVCLLAVPGVIYLRPGILAAVGIPYLASLLVLPLLPAAALGLTAVWAMAAATRDDERE
ncbi:MAG: hypothetical protein ABEK02_02165 [Haloquadratum sp.]